MMLLGAAAAAVVVVVVVVVEVEVEVEVEDFGTEGVCTSTRKKNLPTRALVVCWAPSIVNKNG